MDAKLIKGEIKLGKRLSVRSLRHRVGLARCALIGGRSIGGGGLVKTGSRRRSVIKEDLVAEEIKMEEEERGIGWLKKSERFLRVNFQSKISMIILTCKFGTGNWLFNLKLFCR